MSQSVRLGLRVNAAQFTLLFALNALVGGMVGLERSVLPLVGRHDFGLSSTSAILAFVLAFGAAKALTNLAAGGLADRFGRKRLLVLGGLVALPVPLLIGLAPSWWFIVAANLLLGVNQGLAWSMTVVMKIDLAGPRRRGLALGSTTRPARWSGSAPRRSPRSVCWSACSRCATPDHTSRSSSENTAISCRPTQGFAAPSRTPPCGIRFSGSAARPAWSTTSTTRSPGALAPLYLAAHGVSVREIAVVAAAYPVVLACASRDHRGQVASRRSGNGTSRTSKCPESPIGSAYRLSGSGRRPEILSLSLLTKTFAGLARGRRRRTRKKTGAQRVTGRRSGRSAG